MSKKKNGQVEGFEAQDMAEDMPFTGADGESAGKDASYDTPKLSSVKAEALKKAKREAAIRFRERRTAEKEERIKKAKKLLEVMKENGSFDKLDADLQGFVNNLANPVSGNGYSTESVFTKMFGGNPTVGTKVTLREAFNNTLKGKAELDKRVKTWAEKGIIVTYQQDSDNIFESTYTIEALA